MVRMFWTEAPIRNLTKKTPYTPREGNDTEQVLVALCRIHLFFCSHLCACPRFIVAMVIVTFYHWYHSLSFYFSFLSTEENWHRASWNCSHHLKTILSYLSTTQRRMAKMRVTTRMKARTKRMSHPLQSLPWKYWYWMMSRNVKFYVSTLRLWKIGCPSIWSTAVFSITTLIC